MSLQDYLASRPSRSAVLEKNRDTIRLHVEENKRYTRPDGTEVGTLANNISPENAARLLA